MKIQEARTLATRWRGSLFRLLEAVFGDAPTAAKFSRFTLQRLEGEADEIEGGPDSPLALLILARETCSEYLSNATFQRTMFAQGDRALALAAVPDVLVESAATSRTPEDRARALLAALPCAGRIVLRLLVADRLASCDVEALFGFTPSHLASFLDRVQLAVGPGQKLSALEPLIDQGLPPVPELDVPGFFAHSSATADAVREELSPRTEPTVVNGGALSGPRGSAPRGSSLSPKTTGGRPTGRTTLKSMQAPSLASVQPPPLGIHPSTVKSGAWVATGVLALSLVIWMAAGTAARVRPAPVAQVATAPAATRTRPTGIGKVRYPGGITTTLHQGQRVVAPAAGDAHLELGEGVEIWLAPRSVARVATGRIELEDGVARVQVGTGPFLGVAEPLRFRFAAGHYVIRKGPRIGTAVATLSGGAVAVDPRHQGMVVEGGRTLTMAAGGEAEIRDIDGRLDSSWGHAAGAVAMACEGNRGGAGRGSEMAVAAGPAAPGEQGVQRALYSEAGANPGGLGGVALRGVAGYRQSF